MSRHRWVGPGRMVADRGSKRRVRRLRLRTNTPWTVWLLALAMLWAITIGARWLADRHEAMHHRGGVAGSR